MAGAFRAARPATGDVRRLDGPHRVGRSAGPDPARVRPAPSATSVVTLWDWGTEHDGRTDSTPSDVRDGTVNANGLVYGVVQPSDILAVIDPVEHSATTIPIPSNAPADTDGYADLALLRGRFRSGRAAPIRAASPWTARAASG